MAPRSDAYLADRRSDLERRVLRPLLIGGDVEPVSPFGARAALRLGTVLSRLDDPLDPSVNGARLRTARLLAPVDDLPSLASAEWALTAGLSDLLQVTNHHLGSALARNRYPRLLANVAWLCSQIPAPRTPREALARHATFSRVFDLVRIDSTVSWWTGSARFRGERPPSRLLAWRELRRVRVDEDRVGIARMSAGIAAVPRDAYRGALALWVSRSPLTDLALAGRSDPPFSWSASTLALIGTSLGRALALRAILREGRPEAESCMGEATAAIPAGMVEARRLAEGFAKELADGLLLQG